MFHVKHFSNIFKILIGVHNAGKNTGTKDRKKYRKNAGTKRRNEIQERNAGTKCRNKMQERGTEMRSKV